MELGQFREGSGECVGQCACEYVRSVFVCMWGGTDIDNPRTIVRRDHDQNLWPYETISNFGFWKRYPNILLPHYQTSLWLL